MTDVWEKIYDSSNAASGLTGWYGASNLGGTYHSVIGGEAHVCVVPAP